MIAAEYGYEVLPGVALDTPGVEEVLRRRERGLRWGVLALAAEVMASVAVLVTAGPGSTAAVVTAVCLAPVIAVTAGLTWLWWRARRKERLVLRTYGWQVWPVRTAEVRVVAAEGERAQGRRWATDGRVVLLQPDGRSHCSFPVPGDGWDGPPPRGRRRDDQVWFAGDTRFGGMIAEPGGLPFRHVVRSAPGKRRGSGAEDELARRAGLMPRNRRPGS
ncbi:hypothetical protein [Streptomyces lavendofoliae]|uniref:Uncharacterized protein n=1 Tax=Streptomyces lavendofoliae TaxID=67314 RepID=A0A918M4Q8_9ACTN|nr:hypothetical protein [Streptomyces lavendofoliae]GGU38007.1 hypothetical protein GCM10010274_26610 [Streptomyces lavendofoliae]